MLRSVFWRWYAKLPFKYIAKIIRICVSYFLRYDITLFICFNQQARSLFHTVICHITDKRFSCFLFKHCRKIGIRHPKSFTNLSQRQLYICILTADMLLRFWYKGLSWSAPCRNQIFAEAKADIRKPFSQRIGFKLKQLSIEYSDISAYPLRCNIIIYRKPKQGGYQLHDHHMMLLQWFQRKWNAFYILIYRFYNLFFRIQTNLFK